MRAIWLVARREYLGYVTAWGFWLGLLLTPAGLLLGVLLPSLLERAEPARYYAVIDTQDNFASALDQYLEGRRAREARVDLSVALSAGSPEASRTAMEAFDAARADGADARAALIAANAPVSVVPPPSKFVEIDWDKGVENLPAALRGEVVISGPLGDKSLFAAFVVRRDAAGEIQSVEYWSEDVVGADLRSAASGAVLNLARMAVFSKAGLNLDAVRRADLTAPPIVARRSGVGAGAATEVTFADRAPFMASAALAMLLWFLIFSVVNFLLTGTIEERSNKIFDSLLTSVRLTDLLAGKLLGVLMLSATLMGSWTCAALWASLQMSSELDPAVAQFLAAATDPSLLTPALAGFFAGYLMYGAVFLALGALCDTIQEAQALMSPMIILLMTPLLMVMLAVRDPASSVVAAMSWVPPLTPFLMILRAPTDPPIWESLAHLVLMVGFTGLALWASARIYRSGAVHGAGMPEVRRFFGRLVTFGRR
ncbi:MAG: ABC transporter permease [Pseudomonadota bacterium]